MNRQQWEDNIQNSFINQNDYDQLSEEEKENAFYDTLQFGTAGIRGKIGLGPNRLNRYTVQKIAYGISKYLKSDSKSLIVIGYDTRHFSPEFAKTMAEVFSYHNINVKMTRSYTSTPEVSFFTRELNATLGIMITASHNPPEYNGIKVYGSDGGQLIDQPARELSEQINSIIDVFSIKHIPFEDALNQGQVSYISEFDEKKYKDSVIKFIEEIPHSDLSVIFTSLHGTSVPIVPNILDNLNFKNYSLVKEQCEPSGAFPTVKSPNPEDKDAFDLAVKLGKEHDADLLIATDPDADRMGVVVKHNDTYMHLNGNQIGLILLYYRLKNNMGENPVVIKSIVTSDLGKKIAEDFRGEVIEVLTGFKYISDQILKMENSDRTFVLGYEESYGYLLEPFSRDKDAIQTTLYVIKIASLLKQDNLTLIDLLDEIYYRYGKQMEKLFSHTFEGQKGNEKINQIMHDFRKNTPKEILGKKVLAKEDFELQLREDYVNGISEKITLPKANVIKLRLDNGWIALRPSGTEPKIKLYTSLEDENFETLANEINQFIFN